MGKVDLKDIDEHFKLWNTKKISYNIKVEFGDNDEIIFKRVNDGECGSGKTAQEALDIFFNHRGYTGPYGE